MNKAMPKPIVKFEKHVSAYVQPPVVGVFSGEIKASTVLVPIGVARFNGIITRVDLSAERCGQDDSNPLRVSGEIYVNGNKVCTKPPAINGNNGVVSAKRSTCGIQTATSAIQPSVINGTYQAVSEGDVIYAQLVLTRTATPATEIRAVVVSVDIDPELP